MCLCHKFICGLAQDVKKKQSAIVENVLNLLILHQTCVILGNCENKIAEKIVLKTDLHKTELYLQTKSVFTIV